MREIKFRAWFKNESEMKNVAINNVYEGNKTYLHLSPLPMNDYKPIDLMQYTGLKDKNGREIYEGDIMPVNGHNYVVVYHEEYARFCLQTKSGRMFIPSKNSEVIGNIFENSELLEVSK